MRVHRECVGVVVAVCGAAASAAWADGPVMEVARVGHVYYNVRTGERVVTPAGGEPRFGSLFWDNEHPGCPAAFIWAGMHPTGTRAVVWGDLPPQSIVNGYDVAYATNIGADTSGSGVAGLNLVNTFFERYDGGLDPTGAGAEGVASFMLSAIAGGDATLGTTLFQGWVYTVDLEGGFEFVLGDIAGGKGADLDGDGLADFAYGYTFEQHQPDPKGMIGPFLVRPFSLGGGGTATGVPDRFSVFQDDVYQGDVDFGGGDCSANPPRQYASLFMGLYGVAGARPCGPIDYTGDLVIDFSDYLEFLNRYDAQSPSADLNGDGVVDFGDYLEFLNLYEECAG